MKSLAETCPSPLALTLLHQHTPSHSSTLTQALTQPLWFMMSPPDFNPCNSTAPTWTPGQILGLWATERGREETRPWSKTDRDPVKVIADLLDHQPDKKTFWFVSSDFMSNCYFSYVEMKTKNSQIKQKGIHAEFRVKKWLENNEEQRQKKKERKNNSALHCSELCVSSQMLDSKMWCVSLQ